MSIKRIICWFIILILWAGISFGDMITKIPYSAKGEHKGLYKNLIKKDLKDPQIKEIVEFAKKAAKDAGYGICGEQMEFYTYENKRYSLYISVHENEHYYVIHLIPENMSRTSHDLEISIEKKNREIVKILQGS